MLLVAVASGKELIAIIESMTPKDFQTVKNSKHRFDKFNWGQYQGKEVYKIRLQNDETILGLVSLTDHSDAATNAIEIELLEVSNENIGSNKIFENIGGCLIAFACRESFKRGREGYVFLTPKTQLLEHYSSKYGFHYLPSKNSMHPGGLMILYGDASKKMIKKYIGQ